MTARLDGNQLQDIELMELSITGTFINSRIILNCLENAHHSGDNARFEVPLDVTTNRIKITVF
jgi:hypothetical protein